MSNVWKQLKHLPNKGAAIILMVAVAAALVWQKQADRNELPAQPETATFAENDPAMRAAVTRAHATLDDFLATKAAPPPDAQGFSIKIGVVDGEQSELFWIFPFEVRGDKFIGRINDEPQVVDNVAKGQEIEFTRAEIVDWTYDNTATDTMHGNFTGCVKLLREAPEHAEQFGELYGLDCEY